MKLHLRYFGLIADRLGRNAEDVEWEGSDFAIDLRTLLLGIHPELREMSFKIALNEELVEGAHILQDSSEIVLLPPFAGG